MKCLILAGGFAKRLLPLTRDKPKPLLPVNNRPLIDYIMDDLAGLELDEIVVSTNAAFSKQFREWLSTRREKIRLEVEPSTGEANKLGAVKAIDYVIQRHGVDDWLVINADNFLSLRLKDFAAKFDGTTQVGVFDLGDPAKAAGRYGVLEVDGDVIVGFEEKPAKPKTSLVSTGFYVFSKDSLDLIPEFLATNPPDAPGFFLSWLMRKQPLRAHVFKGYWFDIGSPADYVAANLFASKKDSVVHPTAHVSKSKLSRCVVLQDAVIEDSELVDCIVDAGAKVKSARKKGEIVS
jgi:glucose-1-phosphate thymidylyltransferase